MSEWSARALPRLRRDLVEAYRATAKRHQALLHRAAALGIASKAEEGARPTSRPADLVSVVDLRPMRYERTGNASTCPTTGHRSACHRICLRRPAGG